MTENIDQIDNIDSKNSKDSKKIAVMLYKSRDPTVYPPICSDTMRPIRDVIAEIGQIIAKDGITVTYDERDDTIGKDHHIITVNNRTLEEIVPIPNPAKYCGGGCAGCGGADGSIEGAACQRIYRIIPESILRLAIKKVIAELD